MSLVMVPSQKIFDSGWVTFCCLGWVVSATSGFGKFPLKIPNISIFSLWVKKSHLVGSTTSGFGKFPLKIPNFSIFCLLGKKKSHLVRSATSSFGKFPLKIPKFSIFSPRVKNILSGWVKKYPGQRWVGFL